MQTACSFLLMYIYNVGNEENHYKNEDTVSLNFLSVNINKRINCGHTYLCSAQRDCSLVAIRYFSSVAVSPTSSLLLLITYICITYNSQEFQVLAEK